MPCSIRLRLRLATQACGLLLLFTSAAACAAPPHIMVVLMENAGYDSVIGSADYPYVNQLAHQYALATHSYAVSHPSEPNYLALISGSTQGVTDDNYHQFGGQTLADQLSAAGISWRAYMESVNPADIISDTSEYAVKHDPFASFTSILNNPAELANVVPYSQLGNDLANANGPSFMWVTPNLIDDAHDGTPQDGENFLKGLVSQVTRSAWWGNGRNAAIIITWDEGGDNDSSGIGTAQPGGGHIATLVIGPAGQRQYATPVNHYGLLRSLETVYGLSYLNDAANSGNGNLTPLLPTGRAPSGSGAPSMGNGPSGNASPPSGSTTPPGTGSHPSLPVAVVEQVVAGRWLSIPVALRAANGRIAVRLGLRQLRGPATATWLRGNHILLHAPSVPATLVFHLVLTWNTGGQSQMDIAVVVRPAPGSATATPNAGANPFPPAQPPAATSTSPKVDGRQNASGGQNVNAPPRGESGQDTDD